MSVVYNARLRAEKAGLTIRPVTLIIGEAPRVYWVVACVEHGIEHTRFISLHSTQGAAWTEAAFHSANLEDSDGPTHDAALRH